MDCTRQISLDVIAPSASILMRPLKHKYLQIMADVTFSEATCDVISFAYCCFLFSILKLLLRIDGLHLSNLTRCHCTHCTLLLLGPFSTNIIRIWLMLFQVRLLQMTFHSHRFCWLSVSKVFLWIDRLHLSNLSEHHCTLRTHPDEAPLIQISSENGWCCCKWGICWCHFICIVVVDCQFIKYFLGLMDYTFQISV